LTQKSDDCLYESTVAKGDNLFVPAGQPSYWRCQEVSIEQNYIFTYDRVGGQVARKRLKLMYSGSLPRESLRSARFYSFIGRVLLLLAEMQSGGIL